MNTYTATDGHGEITGEYATARAAAEDFVAGGEWGDITETCWVTVRVWPTGDPDASETYTIALDPEGPPCEGGADPMMHEWTSPHDIVGGLPENPGVWGHGGGVLIHEVCSECGAHRWTDTDATDPDTGEQGLRSVRYETASPAVTRDEADHA